MEKYLYFGEATVETTGEACMFPVSSFLAMTPAGAAATTIYFKARNGTAFDDSIEVAHTGSTPKQFMTEVVAALYADQRNPFLCVADRIGTTNGVDITSKIATVGVTTEA